MLALFQVMMIDLVLAGDNAVAIGMAAAGVARAQRRKVIWLGLAAAVGMRIGLALIATMLLGIVGLLLAGGALLLWVCWKLAQDLATRDKARDVGGLPVSTAPVSFKTAFIRILAADLSMSLDNVLGVAGAARDRPMILAFGLLLSIGLTGMAASWIARMLSRRPWIGYFGLVMMIWVAGGMLWQGHRDLVVDLKKTGAYNAAMPALLSIDSGEIARRQVQKGLP
ncbi:MAG: Integral rane protein TerC [Caulobacteraceae bacterium]|nr:Integral rane protein TerC [Caulobacteraceae bacterium]